MTRNPTSPWIKNMRQKLGQHFLKDKNVLERIAALALENDPATILEIGPGHGELTSHLLVGQRPIVAIELDRDLAARLKARLGNPGELTIKQGDVRKELAEIVSVLPRPLHIVGNLPYYLSSFLFRQISKLPDSPERCVFLIQKEVAQRAAAEAGEMNKLAASLRWWSKPKVAFTVPPGAFTPPPKVDSAVLVLERDVKDGREDNYFRIVRAMFAQPRKTAVNNLSAGLSISKEDAEKMMRRVGAKPDCRPQDLPAHDLSLLAAQLG